MTGKTTNTPKADAAANSFVPGRVGVVGLGLMGGSFARAFRAAGVDVYPYGVLFSLSSIHPYYMLLQYYTKYC